MNDDDEDFGVTKAIGADWGRAKHRKATIERCANGYTVDYEIVTANLTKGEYQPQYTSTRERRVFLTNTDLVEFLEKYFSGEPKP